MFVHHHCNELHRTSPQPHLIVYLLLSSRYRYSIHTISEIYTRFRPTISTLLYVDEPAGYLTVRKCPRFVWLCLRTEIRLNSVCGCLHNAQSS
jgi:hypothetical protein